MKFLAGILVGAVAVFLYGYRVARHGATVNPLNYTGESTTTSAAVGEVRYRYGGGNGGVAVR